MDDVMNNYMFVREGHIVYTQEFAHWGNIEKHADTVKYPINLVINPKYNDDPSNPDLIWSAEATVAHQTDNQASDMHDIQKNVYRFKAEFGKGGEHTLDGFRLTISQDAPAVGPATDFCKGSFSTLDSIGQITILDGERAGFQHDVDYYSLYKHRLDSQYETGHDSLWRGSAFIINYNTPVNPSYFCMIDYDTIELVTSLGSVAQE